MKQGGSRLLGGLTRSLLASTAGIAISSSALAQTDSETPAASDSGLVEIVVTAQHRLENLKNVPIAINAVSADTLQNSGITDTSTLVQAVPSLNFTRSGPSGVFVIRGVSTPNGAAGEEGSTAVYVDDVYMPDLVSTVNDFNNIERVEVLNGPQGTLFGRNATGGLIRIITRDPGDHTEVNGQIGYGNYQTYSGQAYFATPLSDKAAFNIAASGQDQGDGFGYNRTLGTDVRKEKHYAVRSKLVLKPTDGWKITLAGDYFHSDDTIPLYLFPISVNTTTHVATGPISGLDSPANYPSGTHLRQWGVSGKIEGDLGFADLTSITSYRKNNTHSDFDIDGTAADLYHLFYDSGSRTFQQEVRLASRTTDPLSWQIGAFYLHGKSFSDQTQAGLALRGAQTHTLVAQVTNSISVFGEATYALTPTTHLTGGLRWNRDHRNLPYGHIDTTILATGQFIPGASNAAPDVTYRNVTFRAALRQDLSDAVNVYASVNKGFKAGEFYLQTPVNPPVKPETIMAYEAGLKGDFFDRHLRLGIAVFHYDITDYQVRATQGTLQTLFNAAKVKVDGVDLNAEVAATSRLRLTAGASWLNSRFARFGGPGTGVIAPGFYPCGCGNASGNQTALAPHFTLNVGGTYTLPLGDSRELRFTANVTHKSSYVFEPDNVLRQPAYTTANASAEFQLNEHFSLEGWIRNLNDERYNVQMVTTVGQAALSAPPRTYGATFKFNY